MKKSLPTISAPTLVTKLPVSGITVKYRPFVIKEQKALLLAQESKDAQTVIETLKNVLSSCTENTLDFSSVPTADLAYFFIQIRIASVGPEVKFIDHCKSCDAEITMSMSLSDVGVDMSKSIKTVKLTEDVGINFRYPSVDDVFAASSDADQEDRSLKMLYTLLECVYDLDSVYPKSEYTEEEFIDWIGNLNESQATSIRKFIENVPEIRHSLDFTCTECGHKQSRLLEGLHNFFRFGSDQ